MTSSQTASLALVQKDQLARIETDHGQLINRVRAIVMQKLTQERYAELWEKRAPWSLRNDQAETIRMYGVTRDGVAIIISDNPERGQFADIVVLLALEKNIRFRYFFATESLEPYYHRLF